ncbi:MAG: M23 family metallopeptidase [Granulosicoccus sp.]
MFVATDSADSLLSTESILQITVVENDNTPQNNPPAIVVDSTYTVQATDSIRIVITTTDADGTNPQLQVENLPDGTELTQTTDSISVLSWSPAEADVGRYVITLNAVDETDSTLITTKNISITVLSAPIEEEMIASTTVSTNGGTLELAGSGSVTFPDGAFENDNVVSIAISTDSAIQENFQTTAAVFKPSSSLGYEITIQTGNTPPLSDTVGVELDVPDEFLNSIPVGNQIELFAQVNEDSGLRIFEIFGADFDPQTNTLFADLPAAVFSNINSTTGEYEAVVTLASTPGLSRPQDPNQQPIDPGAPLICQAASIQCPLSNGCTVTVPFHAVGRHPITGAPSPHLGTNYQTADGDQVLAAADGIIEFSQSGVPGYGETMVLRHSDGSATLYGQLLQRNFQAGEAVLQGSVIATPNVPGSTIASDLRFEYVPNGSIFRSKNRIDPDACIDVLATGSITVRDDGSLADDAFEVLLDGVRLGATDIGASNNFALSNLIPGNKELSITAIVAPDDVGTLEITLDDGITFVDGNNYLSARLEQFETRTYTIIIP